MLKNTNNVSNVERLSLFIQKFSNFFENDFIDKLVYKEFAKEYVLLPLLVKAKIYDENN
jgi:hypothetical protein